MNSRDREYLENRLLAPAIEGGAAVVRLRALGLDAEADRVSRAIATLVDECRAVRRDLFYPERRER